MTEPRGGRPYPVRLDEMNEWAERNRATSEEARRRFVQFVVLECLGSTAIAPSLAFKGGNALRFGYGYPRSTLDLDFTGMGLVEDGESLRRDIDAIVRQRAVDFGVKCRVSSIRRKPPDLARTMPTYVLKVAYMFPGDRHFADFLDNDRNSANTIPVEISFNDVVCETEALAFGETGGAKINVCTLEDIVAEKLRAILQQVIRNRSRPQDVYDVARIARVEGSKLDSAKVARYLNEKCAARGIIVTEDSFDDRAMVRAQFGYSELRGDLGHEFIPFDEAWASTIALAHLLLSPKA